MAGFGRIFSGFLLAAGMTATAAQAQTVIDAGKTAPQLFASDCAPCHKTPQGLYKGSLGLSGFLREHYTASRENAAVLADYLAKVGDGKPAQAGQRRRDAKPGADGTAAKPAAKKDAKGDGKSEPKTDAKPADAKPAEAKPAEAKPVEAKPVEAKPAEAKPAAESKPAETPAAKPAE